MKIKRKKKIDEWLKKFKKTSVYRGRTINSKVDMKLLFNLLYKKLQKDEGMSTYLRKVREWWATFAIFHLAEQVCNFFLM